jgi:fatty acid desaturase
MFATFIFVLFYRYDIVTASLWIRYPGILLGEGYNWHPYACRLFCSYEMPTTELLAHLLAALLGVLDDDVRQCFPTATWGWVKLGRLVTDGALGSDVVFLMVSTDA